VRFIIRYDPGARAAYLWLGGAGRVSDSVIPVGNATVDLDSAGHVIGIQLTGVDRPELTILTGPRVTETVEPPEDIL
jgi:uncharacterized protein YuzE